MKQIKTIYKNSSSAFDDQVNAALKEGWTLVRRTFDAAGFLAELEREEPSCKNCKHFRTPLSQEPCRSCEDANGAPDQWEAAT